MNQKNPLADYGVGLQSAARALAPTDVFINESKGHGTVLRRISLDKLVYIEANTDYMIFHMSDGKKHWTNVTLKRVLECLPGYFVQVHRSRVVNLHRVVMFDATVMELEFDNGNQTVMMSGSCYQELKKNLIIFNVKKEERCE